MDKHTFGESEAAEVLSDIMEKYEGGWKSSVKRRLDKFREILSNLELIENGDYQKYLAQLLLKDYQLKTEENNWPEEVKTFFLNIIQKNYREFIK